jgi:hypothetical protein
MHACENVGARTGASEATNLVHLQSVHALGLYTAGFQLVYDPQQCGRVSQIVVQRVDVVALPKVKRVDPRRERALLTSALSLLVGELRRCANTSTTCMSLTVRSDAADDR